jgi:hypothetical protein
LRPGKRSEVMWLEGFGPRPENPRVGSSILSLATIQRKIKHVDL